MVKRKEFGSTDETEGNHLTIKQLEKKNKDLNTIYVQCEEKTDV